ncbi:MerR family DNA-binding transcriptional regulator [Devosia psychrophila]|uniref:HTH merR-type domain-containing protein n=1 Tax=Devosia psychrophila TaxID=728005 RepID=A0A1I1JXP5_9HYPH|nr:MerR family DNA-binding transcriptional regulator [Devosia psychrophila]SFC51248.1 hypothetical protein SAMN04488059_10664 [Devosia psychrophila]
MHIKSLCDLPISFVEGSMAVLRARGVEFITIEEFADLAGVNVKTLRRDQAKGLLPPRYWRHRQFFYRSEQVHIWIEMSRFHGRKAR